MAKRSGPLGTQAFTSEVLVKHLRSKKHEDGTITRWTEPTLYSAHMEIDVPALLDRLGTRAAFNGSKKASFLHGLVRVVVKKMEN